MKSHANIKKSDMEFAVGDFVYLKLQPYRQLVIRINKKLAKQGNRVVVYGLIQWSNSCEEDANWELLTDLKKRFPEFDIDP
ncbi:hypothetical protein Tco_0858819 [Tanacetum coccineum]|uniref:Chromo domain-containing protein n=1 Tax=Tanacetum coccineum TaxID=301880 RepID=A0ABQ5BCE2_9ASTR